MKRTLLLVAFLLVIASLLLFYAVSITPTKKPTPSVIPTIPATVAPTKSPADTSLYFSPDYVEMITSDSVSMDIMINSGKNQITGVQLEIGYDPEVFSDISLTPGTFLPQSIVLLNENDEKTGRISYALVLSPQAPPKSGIGVAAKIRLKKFTGVSQRPNPTTISILPKSLVSALGVEGSVLREAKNASITYITSSDAVSLETPQVGNSTFTSPSP